MKTIMAAMALGAMLCASPLAGAENNHPHAMMITDAWSRETTPAARVGGGYLTIANNGMDDDRLIAVTAPHAGKTEVHTMTMKDDVMVMRPLENGLVIAAGETVRLAPGGAHLMFMKLNQPHVAGEPFEATLTFETAGETTVIFDVLSMRESMERAAQSEAKNHHGDHGHGDSHNNGDHEK